MTRALNGEANYRRPTYAKRAERIKALARKHGYRANTAAQAMSTGRFNAIGFLHSNIPNRSYTNAPLLQGVYGELARHNLHMTSAALPDEDLADPERMPKLLRELTADGLLIDYMSEVPQPMSRLLTQHRIPAVWLNTKRQVDCVYPDDIAAGRLATEHLLERGHRGVTFLSVTNSNHYSVDDRIEGYKQVMREAGLEPRIVKRPDVPWEDRFEYCQHLLEEEADTGLAYVCYGSESSTPIAAAGLRRGMALGRDMSIVSFAETPDVALGVLMSTVILPFDDVGRAAVAALIQKIQDPSQPLPPRTCAPWLETGATT
ncbi:MAG: LacI family DNA-binding transcriptional regulator [Planctomycetota bacterium]